MKRIIILMLLTMTALWIQAQDNFQQILNNIEENNLTLKAYREKGQAEKIGNKIENNLENPEAQFTHGWGSPKATEENEMTFSLTQSFDFPTAYKHRSQLISEQNKQVDFTYQQQRKDLLQEARLLCVELAYRQKQDIELRSRYKYAKELADSYQKLFDKGSINILERNKTQLNLLAMEKSVQLNKVEIVSTFDELTRMNSGIPLTISDLAYPAYSLPVGFDAWLVQALENNPTMKIAEQNVAISKKDETLARSMNLPKLSAGYTSEYVGKSRQHGFMVGMSIPLWKGRNTVKYKKAQTVALTMEIEDTRMQFRNSLQKQYMRANQLALLLKEYNTVLKVTNNKDLLDKAFDKGQLSLINYLLELEVYYDTIDKYYETERDYQLAIAQIMQWQVS